MADLSITSSNVNRVSGNPTTGRLNVDGSAGDAFYLDADGELKKCDATDSDKPGSGESFGMILNDGSAGQEVLFADQDDIVIELGASVVEEGKLYVVSETAGKWCEQSDLTTGTNEKQSVSISGASSGSITLTFDGEETSAIAYDATAADVKTALEGNSNIDRVGS